MGAEEADGWARGLKGLWGGIKNLLGTGSVVFVPCWRGGLVRGELNQHPEPGVQMAAQPLFHWVKSEALPPLHPSHPPCGK